MKFVRILRFFVVCEIILVSFTVASDYWLQRTLPPELQEYLKNEETGLTFVPAVYLFYSFILVIICQIIGWIGLWRLWAPGRIFYTCAWCAGIVYVGIMGPSVNPGLTSALNDAVGVVGGMIFGLIYFSDLRFDFRRKSSPSAKIPKV